MEKATPRKVTSYRVGCPGLNLLGDRVAPADDADARATAALQAHVLGGRQVQVLPQEGVEGGVRWIVSRLHLVRKAIHIELDAHRCTVVGRMELFWSFVSISKRC